jgi:hypothetical protein
MIVSVHLVEAGWRRAPGMLRYQPDPADVPGMTYAEAALSTPLRDRPVPRPGPGRFGLIAAWEDDQALDGFLADHPLAERLAEGWHARLEPVRLYGSWAGMPDLPRREKPVDDGEPVAVLTLGRPRISRAVPFLRTSAPAERAASANPAVLASTALARPPRFVSTFSIWRSAAEMREYAAGNDGAHHAAVAADRADPFHHESAFVRFRPYASEGEWDGADPLAAVEVKTA